MADLSRRGFLKAVGLGAGALAGTRLVGSHFIESAYAATSEPTSLVVVYLDGGINAIFTGADAFTNTAFGVTGNNVTALGGGLVIDSTLANAIPADLRTKVASVGIRHGISDHGGAQRANFASGNASAALTLANAIGGSGAIKAAVVGGNSMPGGGLPAPVNGVSLQSVTDMRATIDAIAGATPAANTADREGAAKGIAASEAMSKAGLTKNVTSLASVGQGFTAAVATLNKPIQPFNAAEFNTAYGLNATAVRGFASQLAAAELMVRSGTNFVIAQNGGWDTHGDTNGNTVRNKMTALQPALRTFLTRMSALMATQNVMVAVMGDFNRSLPGSDHQANNTALVIGKNIKNGTTGKTDTRVGLAATTPNVAGFWQLMGAAAKVDANPFGANPHTVLVA